MLLLSQDGGEEGDSWLILAGCWLWAATDHPPFASFPDLLDAKVRLLPASLMIPDVGCPGVVRAVRASADPGPGLRPSLGAAGTRGETAPLNGQSSEPTGVGGGLVALMKPHRVAAAGLALPLSWQL